MAKTGFCRYLMGSYCQAVLYHFIRLPFGLITSQDIFLKELGNTLEGLLGITGIADDNFV